MKVELHPEAQAETRRAAIWYDERQLGLGDRFFAAVTGTLAGGAATPRAYPVWVALKRPPMPVRRARVTGFPYLVAFEVHRGTVSVLAVAHAKRRNRRIRCEASGYRVLITLDNDFGELLDAADAGLSVSEAETALTPASDPACWPARADAEEYCRRTGGPDRAGHSRRTPEPSGQRASEPPHRYA